MTTPKKRNSNPNSDWQTFWFEPLRLGELTVVRICVCSVAGLWWLSFLGEMNGWFGADGLLARPVAAPMIAMEGNARWMVWSPLWFSDGLGRVLGMEVGLAMSYAWVTAGLVFSLLAASGFGGRLIMGILLGWTIAWTHRILWLKSPVEPALIASLGYLLVQPGVAMRASELARNHASWTARVALRALQCHWWILIAAGLLSQSASLIWWRGEAVWWLAAANRSTLLYTDFLSGKAALINGLTHAIVVLEMATLWLIVVPIKRYFALGLGLSVSLVFALVADYLLYGLLLAAMLSSFAGRQHEPLGKNSSDLQG